MGNSYSVIIHFLLNYSSFSEWRFRIRHIESRDEVLGLFRQCVNDVVNDHRAPQSPIHSTNELRDDRSVSIQIHHRSAP